MIITICGTIGSGKSTVGKLVAKTFGYKYYSGGDIYGKYALEHGLTVNQLNKKSEKDHASDKLVDEHLAEVGKNEDNVVIDARLGYYFIPNSIKVFIDAKEDVRIKRVLDAKRPDEMFKSEKEAKHAMDARIKSDIKRYESLYKTNPYDLSHFDLILDSTDKTPEKLAGEVYRFSMFKSNPSIRK